MDKATQIMQNVKTALLAGSVAGRIDPALKAVYFHPWVKAYPSAALWFGTDSSDFSGVKHGDDFTITVFMLVGDPELVQSQLRACCVAIRQEINLNHGCGADSFIYQKATLAPGWEFSNPQSPVPCVKATMRFLVKFKEDH